MIAGAAIFVRHSNRPCVASTPVYTAWTFTKPTTEPGFTELLSVVVLWLFEVQGPGYLPPFVALGSG